MCIYIYTYYVSSRAPRRRSEYAGWPRSPWRPRRRRTGPRCRRAYTYSCNNMYRHLSLSLSLCIYIYIYIYIYTYIYIYIYIYIYCCYVLCSCCVYACIVSMSVFCFCVVSCCCCYLCVLLSCLCLFVLSLLICYCCVHDPATRKHGWSKHGFSRVPSKHTQIANSK